MRSERSHKEKLWEEDRRRCFARYCWQYAQEIAPSGLTWAKVFEKLEGMPLLEYAESEQQRQKEKREAHKERGVQTDLPL